MWWSLLWWIPVFNCRLPDKVGFFIGKSFSLYSFALHWNQDLVVFSWVYGSGDQRNILCHLYAPFEKLMSYKISFCFGWSPQQFLSWVFASCGINNSYRQCFKSQRLSLKWDTQNAGILFFSGYRRWFCCVFFFLTTCNWIKCGGQKTGMSQLYIYWLSISSFRISNPKETCLVLLMLCQIIMIRLSVIFWQFPLLS